jgi:hypothetical protein
MTDWVEITESEYYLCRDGMTLFSHEGNLIGSNGQTVVQYRHSYENEPSMKCVYENGVVKYYRRDDL